MNGGGGFNLMHALQSQHQQQYQWQLQQILFGSGERVAPPPSPLLDEQAAAVAALQQMHRQILHPPVSMHIPPTGMEDSSTRNNSIDSENHEAALLVRIVSQVGRNSIAPKTSLWDEVASKVSRALGYMREAKTCMENFENLSRKYKKLKQGGKTSIDQPHLRELDEIFASINVTNPGLQQNTNNLLHLVREAEEYALGNADGSCNPSSSESAAGAQLETEIPSWQNSWKATKSHLENLVKKSLELQEAWQQEFLDKFDKATEQEISQHEAMRKLQESQEQAEVQALKWRINFDAGLTSWISGLTTDLEQQGPSPSGCFNVMTDANTDQDSPTSVGRRNLWSDREVEELVNFRAEMDRHFFEAGKNKHVLWEEIAQRMSKEGYIRSSKRCKEKWENVNKSFKKQKTFDKFPHSMLRGMYLDGRIRTASSDGGDTDTPEVMLLMEGSCVKNHDSSWLSNNNTNDGSVATGNASLDGNICYRTRSRSRASLDGKTNFCGYEAKLY